MPRVCSICSHPERAAIDKALAIGTPKSEVSALFRVSPDAVDRHNAAHLPARLVKAQEAEDVRQALDGVKQLKAINGAALLLGELDERPHVNVLVTPEWLALRGAILATLVPYAEARAAVATALVRLDGGAA